MFMFCCDFHSADLIATHILLTNINELIVLYVELIGQLVVDGKF